MRTFDDLSEQDKGIYIARDCIVKLAISTKKGIDYEGWPKSQIQLVHLGILEAINTCNNLLDIATLGDIK